MGNMAQISDFSSRYSVSVGGLAWVEAVGVAGDRDGIWIFNPSVDKGLIVRYIGGGESAPGGVPVVSDGDCLIGAGQTVWHPVGQSVGAYLAFEGGGAGLEPVIVRETK